MLDGLAAIFAALFFWGGLFVLVFVVGFMLVFSIWPWPPEFTFIAICAVVSVFCGLAMLQVLRR